MSQPVIRRPVGQRLSDLRRGPLTALIWGLAVVGTALLIQRQARPADVVGLARVLQYELAAPGDGSLEALRVGLYEEVEEGDILALFDGALLEARIATAALEVEYLRAQLEVEEQRLTFELRGAREEGLAELRRFRIDQENRSLSMLEVRVNIEVDRIERDRVALLTQRSKAMVEEDIGSEADYDNNRLRFQLLGRRIEQNEQLLARTEVAYEAAGRRSDEFEREILSAGGAVLPRSPLSEAIAVQRSLLDAIQLERRSLALRAPARSLVSAIHAHAGESVRAGQPILTLADPESDDVIAYLPAEALDIPEAGAVVEVSARQRPERVAPSVVTRVGPTIEQLPERLWRMPGRPEFGRPLLIEGPSGLELTPGELVAIRLPRP